MSRFTFASSASNKPIATSYDPPRAGQGSRWRNLWDELRQSVLFERFRPTGEMGFGRGVLSWVCPGYVFGVMGWKLMGRIIMAGYGLAWVIFLATIGQGVSNGALGLLLAAHGSSIVGWLVHQFGPLELKSRIVLALTTLACLYVLAYRPVLHWIYGHWAMPLRLRDRVVVIEPGIASHTLVRGETMAYRFETVRIDGLYLQGGLGLEPILAQAGDRVEFFPDRCEINGVPGPKQPLMPDQGHWVVPQNYWLIWPNMDMVLRNRTEVAMEKALIQTAMVSEQQLIGKPYRHWFGRRQLPRI